ncbi:MAG: hypothetical protein KIT56_04525 [Gammaproteobacteria bacterium]|nr:hypothetical protein [Gammaproteobacteria bacterium]MCW5583143.1 hypothetical protein [Gammaproteobacteria bacterium]
MNKIILSIVIFATITRIAIPPFIGHLPNFSAVDAIALFSGAYFHKRSTALLIVLSSIWIGDIFLSKMFTGEWVLFYSGFYWQYASYLLITCIGSTLKGMLSPIRLVSSCFISAILFFIISNFGVWYSGLLYPLTLDGFITCYVSAIPFFKNTLLSDLFFSILLFGIFGWFMFTFPVHPRVLHRSN